MCLTILCIGCTFSFGKSPDDRSPKKTVNSKPKDVVSAFIDSYVHTDVKLFDQVMSEDAVVSFCNGRKVEKQTKSALLSFYKQQGETDLNCESDYEILSSSGNVVMVRVDFKFPTFLQRNFLTIEKNEQGIWEVTKVNKFNENL
ncbi:Putative lumazine-binding [Pedobacter caeni]|uniref:Putative lumazine-binding n=2 Tax=Pedobacter caeni TaxID=288992 RepID=A0A1M5G4J4_9SPHI|nr:Putative lumazine-binding [Pedobacter caeni]